ncbi:MAG TPA: citrate transporter [Usitatibacter sp.]|nr:citrate transporter [Usitatibacter sp.]
MLGSVPLDFVLFALMLAGVAVFHRHTFRVALAGFALIASYQWAFTGFAHGSGWQGLEGLFAQEWITLANLFLLLMGFALLARHFEDSRVPAELPKILPGDWRGGFVLLLMVFVLSSFLDNIAAALIGGAMASAVFRRRVHIGYLAAIVAAANAGGSGSVVGDTTTTMMWIAGVKPGEVFEAYVAAATALLIFGVVAARQQQAYSPILKTAAAGIRLDWARLAIVAFILSVTVAANVVANLWYPEALGRAPVIGLALWGAILVSLAARRPDWSVMPATLKGTLFLLLLVACAAMMPVDKLPVASWQAAFALGFLSAAFDNIPLTALALHQGGYDWGFVAYAVGFGGSIIWFGSSAGVALCNKFPEARSVGLWLRHGWHIALGYVVGFFVMLAVLGFHPDVR